MYPHLWDARVPKVAGAWVQAVIRHTRGSLSCPATVPVQTVLGTHYRVPGSEPDGVQL